MAKMHEFIKAKREERGWDKGQMAKRTGLSVSEYCDIEWHENELVQITPLMNARRIAEAIDISIYELYGLENWKDEPGHWVPRTKIIADARRALGATVAEMGDGIGFEDIVVEALESFNDLLEIYCYEVLEMVAKYLKIAPQQLLYRHF